MMNIIYKDNNRSIQRGKPSEHRANGSAATSTIQSLSDFQIPKKGSTAIRMSELLGRGDSITYPCLVGLRRRGLRNGSWGRLESGQRALFHCAMWIARARGRVCNAKLMVQVLRVAMRLMDSARSKILRLGRSRSASMLANHSKPNGVFAWAPKLREWLNEAGYVWYLGILEVNP